MASLMCRNCGDNIRFHSDFDREFLDVAIPVDAWTTRSANRSLIEYKIENARDCLVVWTCHRCETRHLFKGYDARVFRAFVPVESLDSQSGRLAKSADFAARARRYRFFDEEVFYRLAERNATFGEVPLVDEKSELAWLTDTVLWFTKGESDAPIRVYENLDAPAD